MSTILSDFLALFKMKKAERKAYLLFCFVGIILL